MVRATSGSFAGAPDTGLDPAPETTLPVGRPSGSAVANGHDFPPRVRQSGKCGLDQTVKVVNRVFTTPASSRIHYDRPLRISS